MKYKLKIAYEGTHYHGWQIQPNGTSIQEIIEKVLATILREDIKLIGAGRTDAGVHALSQVAHFKSEKELSIYTLLRSLNGLLPPDIRILSIECASNDFHAQYSALAKTYRYHIYLDKVLNPFKRNFVWHIPYPIDLQRLTLASGYFLGTHDFTSFANEAHRGVAAHDSVRTMQRIDLIPEEGGFALEFEGDGFLYKMVRNMTGFLIECASGKREPEDVQKILLAKDRRQAGVAAPPQGLFLVKIKYSSDEIS